MPLTLSRKFWVSSVNVTFSTTWGILRFIAPILSLTAYVPSAVMGSPSAEPMQYSQAWSARNLKPPLKLSTVTVYVPGSPVGVISASSAHEQKSPTRPHVLRISLMTNVMAFRSTSM